MKPPPALLLLLMLTNVMAQITVPMSGQCQAICLKEMALKKEFIALNGDTFLDFDVSNNTDFSLCKLGCHSPDFSELALPAFRRGQAAYQTILERSSDAPLSSSPVSSVYVLCADSHSNGSIVGRLLLRSNISSAGPLVYHIEGVRRQSEDAPEAIFFATWSYSPFIEFSSAFKESPLFVQFRVTTFDSEGIKGQAARSPWIPSSSFLTAGNTPIITKPRRTMWKDDAGASELSLETTNGGFMSCSLSLSYSADDHHEQSIEFQLDRSTGFLLERLHFDRTYMIRVDPASLRTSSNPPLSLHVPACLQMVSDASLCAPSAVSEINWKWNLSRSEGNTVLLNWVYSPEEKPASEKSSSSTSRMVHFEVTLTPAALCQYREAQRRIITWTHRSVLLYVADEHCEYEVEVVVVDSKGRRSPSKRATLRHEEPSVLALTSRWNVEMMILLALLAVLLVAALGMAACRVRDRNTFNTLKREHRQLTKSIVVAQATLPRHKCLTVIDGKGRPISTDKSEIGIPVQPRFPQLPAIFYDDEGVYDSLDTPTHSDPIYFDRSIGTIKRANPIYAGVNVHGLMTLPMERLNMTSCAKNPTKPWINASAIDRVDATSYFIKYSAEDSSALRHELSVLSHISTDHPNLLYFHGVATKESQVLAVLFEPIRGGSLRGFLAEIRATLEGRSPTSSSSGYDGSDRDSLDNDQIDRLTSQLCSFARHIASGLTYIHSQRCVHGGLSPASVYLMKSWKDPLRMPCDQLAKIADFDQAQAESSADSVARLPSEITPPEVLSGRPHTIAGDMWQMGLLLAEMVSIGGCPSLWESSAGAVSEKAVKNFYANLTAGHKMNPGLCSLKKAIPRCLSVDFKRRCSSRDLESQLLSLQHQYSDLRPEHVDSVEV